MSATKKPGTMQSIYILAIALIGFSYAITTPWLLQLGLPTGNVNVAVKGIISLMFFVSIIYAGSWNGDGKIYIFPLLIFFLLYSLRIIYDVVALGIVHLYSSPFYIFSYYFGLTVIPVFAIAKCAVIADVRKIHDTVFYALIIANVSLLLYVLVGGDLQADSAFSGRFQIDGDLEGTAILNPILLGTVGAILAAFTLGRVIMVRSTGLGQHVMHAGLIAIAGTNILFGASRGPAVAFGLCVVTLCYSLIRGGLGIGQLKPRWPVLIYIALLIVALITLIVTQSNSIFLFSRFTDMFTSRAEGGREERDFILETAWGDFLGSPMIGSSYATSYGAASPHNIVVESLMATGVFGGALLALAMFMAVRGVVRLLNGHAGPHGYSLALASICFMVLALTSGSISQFPEFWVFVALMTALGHDRHVPQRPLPRTRIRPPPPSFHRI